MSTRHAPGVFHGEPVQGLAVLHAFDSRGTNVALVFVPPTAELRQQASDAAWALLDAIDPAARRIVQGDTEAARRALFSVSEGGNTGEPAKVDRRRKPRQALALLRG